MEMPIIVFTLKDIIGITIVGLFLLGIVAHTTWRIIRKIYYKITDPHGFIRRDFDANK
jgi:hypothetical protein